MPNSLLILTDGPAEGHAPEGWVATHASPSAADPSAWQDCHAVLIEAGEALGPDLCRKLRVAGCARPLIVATPQFMSASVRTAWREAGADHCLPLPYDRAELASILFRLGGSLPPAGEGDPDLLRETQERSQAALSAAGIGVFDFNPVTGTFAWDDRLRAIWGLREGQTPSRDLFRSAIHPEDRPQVLAAVDRAMADPAAPHYSADYRIFRINDGAERWLHAEGTAKFREGRPVRFVGTAQDITERKRSEHQIELLLREVNHRSKNMLAVVQAMASQSALRSDPATFTASFTERLHSLAASHDLLVNNNWRGVGLKELVASQLGHFDNALRKRVSWEGPDIRLGPAAAQALGMALHELATNAAKYGALSAPGGAVSLIWEVSGADGEAQFSMRWEERGGPPVKPPLRKGFGSRLISQMTELTIGGEVDLAFAPGGVTWRVSAPLERLTGP